VPIEVEVPQFGVEVQQLQADVYVIMLVFSSSGQQTKVYLCEASQNYQQIAKQIHDGICDAGGQARRMKSGLVTVRDLPDSLKGVNLNGTKRASHSQERQQRGQGRSG